MEKVAEAVVLAETVLVIVTGTVVTMWSDEVAEDLLLMQVENHVVLVLVVVYDDDAHSNHSGCYDAFHIFHFFRRSGKTYCFQQSGLHYYNIRRDGLQYLRSVCHHNEHDW